ncbi:bifunctional DNA primase/polymerase [Dermacoccus nishinomiyaensis]
MSEHTAFTRAVAGMNASWTTSAAAERFAAFGVPVFPCVPGGKRPLTEHGFHDATTDPGQVAAWWGQSPGANIGIPTGSVSGVDVVDVDVHAANGYEAMRRADRAGLVGGWEVIARSPSGGMHAYYPASSMRQGSWAVGRAGVDFRGDGGYIIAPPSRRQVDGSPQLYRVEQISRYPGHSLDAGGLREFLDPRPLLPRQDMGRRFEAGRDVDRLAAWVAKRPEGERNHGLFWAACIMAEHDITPGDALDVLTDAAGHAGLSAREVAQTVRSAYRTVHGTPTASATQTTQAVFDRAPTGSPVAQGRGLR